MAKRRSKWCSINGTIQGTLFYIQNNLSLQDAFPGIAVATHLVNANAFTEMFMNVSKPFLNKEVSSKVSNGIVIKVLKEIASKERKEISSKVLKKIVSYVRELLVRYVSKLLVRYIRKVFLSYVRKLLVSYVRKLLVRYVRKLLVRYVSKLLVIYVRKLLVRYVRKLLVRYVRKLLVRYVSVMRTLKTTKACKHEGSFLSDWTCWTERSCFELQQGLGWRSG
jgi:hypothetical protein